MKVEFKTGELEHWYLTPLEEIKGKLPFSKDIIKQFKKKVQILTAISSLQQLRQFRGLNFEHLKGDRVGEYSIRLNDQYRLLFEETAEGELSVILINEISKHYE